MGSPSASRRYGAPNQADESVGPRSPTARVPTSLLTRLTIETPPMNGSSNAALPFVIEVCGRFEPRDLRASYDPSPRPSTPELENVIAEEWERQTILARDAGRLLFNGGLLRHVRHEVCFDTRTGHDVFHLTVGPTCYRDFVGTNLFNRRIEEFGRERFSNPIGTTATLVSRDGLICYGRRSHRVAYHGGFVHTFGGALEEQDQDATGDVDPFASLCRELSEELALGREDLEDLHCVGLIRDQEIHQPELLFEARLRLTADDLLHRWETAEARDEHDGLVTLPNLPDAVLPFIRTCGPIAPVAIGGLFLHGRLTWGPGWFEQARAQL